MVQVFFGKIRSYDDLGLILTNAEITAPEPKRSIVTVPGRDGSLDLSEVLSGDVKFENRQLKLTFTMKDYRQRWLRDFSYIYNQIHGKNFHSVVDNDPEYYWEGFCAVDKSESSYNKGVVTVVCDVYPYKHKAREISVTSTSSGISLKCLSGREAVCPSVTTSGNITFTCNNKSVSLSAGTWKKQEIVFREGINNVSITGHATVKIAYVEGTL